MLMAYSNGQYVKATPHIQAECPHCHEHVIPKCGEIKIWHWAHKAKCIYHTEPETEWHLQWKELALKHEAKVEVRFDEHIADAVIGNVVYEF
jgi:competence protein CoiA